MRVMIALFLFVIIAVQAGHVNATTLESGASMARAGVLHTIEMAGNG